MADPADWRNHHNDLWHWFKHAQPFIAGKALIPPEMLGIGSPEGYLSVAREICRKAVAGETGTSLRVRQRHALDVLVTEYLVWYEPPGARHGIFLVVKDCGSYGELQTMFPPTEGRNYFDEQEGDLLQ